VIIIIKLINKSMQSIEPYAHDLIEIEGLVWKTEEGKRVPTWHWWKRAVKTFFAILAFGFLMGMIMWNSNSSKSKDKMAHVAFMWLGIGFVLCFIVYMIYS